LEQGIESDNLKFDCIQRRSNKKSTMNLVSSAAAFAVLSAPVVFAGGATELTLDTFDNKRGSKNAFVKFQAPW
jgi:hypothetical protein